MENSANLGCSETDRQTDRQKLRGAETETERGGRDRQTDRQTDREKRIGAEGQRQRDREGGRERQTERNG